MSAYVVYILRCQNDTFYTGYTTNLDRRYSAHLAGKCKYTRSFKPIGIAQHWVVNGNKGDAMRIERYIKSLSRQQKDALILSPTMLLNLFNDLQLGHSVI